MTGGRRRTKNPLEDNKVGEMTHRSSSTTTLIKFPLLMALVSNFTSWALL